MYVAMDTGNKSRFDYSKNWNDINSGYVNVEIPAEDYPRLFHRRSNSFKEPKSKSNKKANPHKCLPQYKGVRKRK